MNKLSIIAALLTVATLGTPASAASPATTAAKRDGMAAASADATCGRPANPADACHAAKPAPRAAARLSTAAAEKLGQRQLDSLIASIQ